MKRLAVLISGGGSNLQSIIDAASEKKIDAEIVVVVSNKADAFGLKRAENAGIKTEYINHKDFSSREMFDQTLVRSLSQYQPDLIVLAGFMRILTPIFVDAFQGKIMNIHPSLLPKYPGLHTHQRAMDAGDKRAGATVHFVTAELDGGPLIIQANVPILPEDKSDELAKRVLVQEHRIYPKAIALFCQGRLKLTDNGILLDDKLLSTQGIVDEV